MADFIRQLMEAENKAKKKMEDALQEKKKKMTGAKAKALEDLKAYEAMKTKETNAATSGQTCVDAMNKQLASETLAEVAKVQQQYDQHKQNTVKYIVSKILDVPITLTATQIQSLKTGAV